MARDGKMNRFSLLPCLPQSNADELAWSRIEGQVSGRELLVSDDALCRLAGNCLKRSHRLVEEVQRLYCEPNISWVLGQHRV